MMAVKLTQIVALTLIASAALVSSEYTARGIGPTDSTALRRSDTRTFEVRNGSFYKDGEKTTLVSGSFHYFRCHPAQWRERLEQMKQCGLNAVQFYIPWNIHEPEEGKFTFNGIADVELFIKTAHEVGLMVILRPGPYACGEWEFGGHPYWLLEKDVVFRSSDENYLSYVKKWWDVLLPKMVPLLYSQGGPIVLSQIENEYGSYGSDKKYLENLRDLALQHYGNKVAIHSTDGNQAAMLANSQIDGVFQTVDFGVGTDVKASFNLQAKSSRINGPSMNSEFYPGWLTHWGEPTMGRKSADDIVKTLQDMFEVDASVNFYMFFGGTNFAFLNGANANDGEKSFQPVVTSYDYDAPITEAGDYAKKFTPICQTIRDHLGEGPLPLLKNSTKGNYGSVQFTEFASMFASLHPLSMKVTRNHEPKTMEALGQDFGYVNYRTVITSPKSLSDGHTAALSLGKNVRDRAMIYVNGEYLGTLDRCCNNTIDIPMDKHLPTLDILVENGGRVNFGHNMDNDHKGLIDEVTLDDKPLECVQWDMYSLPFRGEELRRVSYSNKMPTGDGPMLLKAELNIDGNPLDTFVNMSGFNKGFIFVNGFNIGRYWSTQGPQYTLYVPYPILKPGSNSVTVVELYPNENTPRSLMFQDYPLLK